MRELVEVALFSGRVEETVRFYGRLLGAAPEVEWPGGAAFAVGSLTLLVHERSAPLPEGPPNEDHVALAVPDLDAACAELAAQGLGILAGPRDFPWGRSAYLRDPDGRLVELTQAPG